MADPSALTMVRAVFLCTALGLHSAPATAQATLASWTTRPEFVIGGEPGSDDALSFVSRVAVTPNGTHIVVSQSLRGGRITAWSPDRLGAPLLELGVRTDAPPHGAPSDIQVDSTGFWVLYAREWGRFSFDGSLKDVVPDPTGDWRAKAILNDDSFIVVGKPPSPHVAIQWMDGDPGWNRVLGHTTHSEHGWSVDTLGSYDTRRSSLGIAWRGNSFFLSHPFADYDLVYLDPRFQRLGIVRRNLRDGGVRVLELTLSGDTVRSIPMSLPAVRLQRDQVDQVVEATSLRIVSAFGQTSHPVSMEDGRRMAKEALHLPSILPAVTAAVLTASGALWVRSSELADSTVVWYAIDRQDPGSVARRILLPKWFQLRDATRTHVWGLLTDARMSSQLHGRRIIPLG